ncbi:MAG: hypothetical protein ACYC2J_02420 [Acidithiobacillus ferrooxidans]|jgi:hypothetical protein
MKTKQLRKLSPFEQGGLDSLCGIYSLINAGQIVNKNANSERLFRSVISYLARNNKLQDTLISGMLFKGIKELVDNIFAAIWKYEIKYAGVPTPELDVFWREMRRFLNGDPKKAIVVGLSGTHDHWTVIKEISDKRLVLHDSDGLCYLSRKHCTTGCVTGPQLHVLHPAQTLFISEKNENK